MTGSTPFSIEKSNNFKRSFKKLAKAYGDDFVELIAGVLEGLLEDQYPMNSRNEPLPGNFLRFPKMGYHPHESAV